MPRLHVPVIRWTGVVSMWCASSLLDGYQTYNSEEGDQEMDNHLYEKHSYDL